MQTAADRTQADHFKGIIRDKTNGGGGTPTKGTGQEGIPAKIHNNGDPDENQESDHRLRPEGGGSRHNREGVHFYMPNVGQQPAHNALGGGIAERINQITICQDNALMEHKLG